MTLPARPSAQRALRVGVFGSGRWAREVHAPGLRATKDVVLAGIYGRDIRSASVLAHAMETSVFKSFDDMLRDVDTISFAVPPDIQASFALMAARAGRHLILEKPVATGLAAADELVDAISQARVASVVFFTRLFLPGVRDLLATARAAGVVQGEAFFRSSALLHQSRYPLSNWRHQPLGALWDGAPHPLAVLLQSMGPVAKIRATSPSPTAFELELQHAPGGISRAHINLQDRSVVGVDDRFVLSGCDGVFSAGPFIYDRVTIFARAAATLSGPREDRYADVTLGRDVVAVIDSAITSLGEGGKSIPIAGSLRQSSQVHPIARH